MPLKSSLKKEDLVKMLVERKTEILQNDHAKQGLIDALLPLSAFNAEIKEFSNDGVITIKFNEDVDGYLNYLSKKKMIAILDAIDNPA
jgi:hypothetical protein